MSNNNLIIITDQAKELMDSLDEIDLRAPWLGIITEQARGAVNEIESSVKERPSIFRQLSRPLLLLGNVIETLEKTSHIKNLEDKPEALSVIKKLPAYIRMINAEVTKAAEAYSPDDLTANLAPLAHHFGEVEEEDVSIKTQNQQSSESSYPEPKKSLLKKFGGQAFLKFKDITNSLSLLEYEVLRRSYVQGGKISIPNGKTYHVEMDWDEFERVVDIDLSNENRTFLAKGAVAKIPPMTPFWSYCNNKKILSAPTQSGDADNNKALFVYSDQEVTITGPAIYGIFAPKHLIGFEGTKRAGLLRKKNVMVDKRSIVFRGVPAHILNSGQQYQSLWALCTKETIEGSEPLYDPEQTMSGKGENTMISYQIVDSKSRVLGRGYEVIKGKMLMDIYKLLMSEPMCLSNFGFLNPLHIEETVIFSKKRNGGKGSSDLVSVEDYNYKTAVGHSFNVMRRKKDQTDSRVVYTNIELVNDEPTINMKAEEFTYMIYNIRARDYYLQQSQQSDDTLERRVSYNEIDADDLGICAELIIDGKPTNQRYSVLKPSDPSLNKRTAELVAAIAIAEGDRKTYSKIEARVFGIKGTDEALPDIPFLLEYVGRSPNLERFKIFVEKPAKSIITENEFINNEPPAFKVFSLKMEVEEATKEIEESIEEIEGTLSV